MAAVLPTDTRITFRCETNSPDLPVIWVGEDLRTEFSAGPTYSVDVPSGGLDGQTFICAVRDPTPNSNNPFFVAYKNSTVRSIQGVCVCVYVCIALDCRTITSLLHRHNDMYHRASGCMERWYTTRQQLCDSHQSIQR